MATSITLEVRHMWHTSPFEEVYIPQISINQQAMITYLSRGEDSWIAAVNLTDISYLRVCKLLKAHVKTQQTQNACCEPETVSSMVPFTQM